MCADIIIDERYFAFHRHRRDFFDHALSPDALECVGHYIDSAIALAQLYRDTHNTVAEEDILRNLFFSLITTICAPSTHHTVRTHCLNQMHKPLQQLSLFYGASDEEKKEFYRLQHTLRRLEITS